MYAKIINDQTKEVIIVENATSEFIQVNGFSEMNVEKSYDGSWYLMGFAPDEPEKSYIEKRQAEYPCIEEQLDMIYWDKVNNTNLWQEKITEIKAKYPKK
jgi:hypothetical protein